MKKKELFLHRATTLEKLSCISNYPSWVKLLFGNGKSYSNFISKMADKNFYRSEDDVRSIKSIAEEFGFKTTDVTKWISEIYFDILQLNEDKPHLFQTPGIKHSCFFRHYDNTAAFTLWLPQSPRKYEQFSFYFLRAQTGISHFWVREVEHEVEDGEYTVSLMLDGKLLNTYREQLVQQALFDSVLHFTDVMNKNDFEIDEVLRYWYKPK